MKALVTGATGLIGNAIAKYLAEGGHSVRALVREAERAKKVLPGRVALCPGDITQPETLAAAMQEVEVVFHAAGMPEQWQPDESIFDRVNRGGTVNVLQAAKDANVRRVVYTSTMDVFATNAQGVLTEAQLDLWPKHTAYERSKQRAEQEVQRFLADGLDVVITNPSAVYGPSPVHVGLNSFFLKVMRKEVPLLPPGGMSVVYIDGVAAAHHFAAESGKRGERYLLSDGYTSNADLAAMISRGFGLPSTPKTAPVLAMKALATILDPLARRFQFEPLISKGQLTFVLWQARVDASKAKRELGFMPTPMEDGVKRTIDFLRPLVANH